jgi:hypothetical protein
MNLVNVTRRKLFWLFSALVVTPYVAIRKKAAGLVRALPTKYVRDGELRTVSGQSTLVCMSCRNEQPCDYSDGVFVIRNCDRCSGMQMKIMQAGFDLGTITIQI